MKSPKSTNVKVRIMMYGVVPDNQNENGYTAGFIRCCNSLGTIADTAWKYTKANPIKVAAGVFASCAAIGIFSTAQETCANIYIDNRTWDSVAPYYDAPFGVGSHGTGYPGADMNITLGGWDHATVKILINLQDYATIHVHKSGLEITTSDLPEDRAIKRQWPYVLFWNCYWQYQEYKQHTSSNSSSSYANYSTYPTYLQENGMNYTSYLRQEFSQSEPVVTKEEVIAFNAMLTGEVVADAMDNTMKGLINNFLLRNTSRELEDKEPRVEEIQDSEYTASSPSLV